MTARRVLMVEPIGFRANPETADDNVFQAPGADRPDPAVQAAARTEFAALRAALEARGIEVEIHVPADHATPDAVFPNNWFSTLPGGTLVLYPMRAPARRGERRPSLVAWLRRRYPNVIDLTGSEAGGRFLEGTGSLVIDEPARIVYASVSRRTDPSLVAEWAERFGHDAIVFGAFDRGGSEIYHTNVVMGLGTGWAVVCSPAIGSASERDRVLGALAATGHETVVISFDQLHDFCGNVLELEGAGGRKFVIMSDRAYRGFTGAQRAALERHAEIVHVDLNTIETHGGGSARCMLAELY